MPAISVVIATLNEERNIERALRSAARLSDEILVIDSGSDDRTVEIARRLGARVMTRRFDDMAAQRNAALRDGGLLAPYAFFMDADEKVTPEFASALQRALDGNPDIDGVRVCRRFHFWGKWIRSASSFPTFIARVVRVGEVWFRKEGHGEVFEGGTVFVDLREPLHDEDLKGIPAWIARHNFYAAMEAKEDLSTRANAGDRSGLRSARARLRSIPGWPLVALFYYMVVRGGILEGRRGWTYCTMKAMYEYFVQLHSRQLKYDKRGRDRRS